MGKLSIWFGSFFAFALAANTMSANLLLADDQPLKLAPVGSYQLRVLTPQLLELTLITAKPPEGAASGWNFIDGSEKCRLPEPSAFAVSCGGKSLPVTAVGFRRRVIYAPLKPRDLRLGNYLYLKLGDAVVENQVVEVKNPRHDLWPESMKYSLKVDPLRWSPVLHANQTGYLPDYAKEAMVGCYLGTMGELDLGAPPSPSNPPEPLAFELLEVPSNREVFRGKLKERPDGGFPFVCYQKVMEADFTAFKTPGEYRLFVAGCGTSYPFRIGVEVAGAFARAYALGVYDQRCGTANALPFTRFTHGPCHTAPAEVPTMSAKFAFVNECLGKMSADFKENPRHTAPQLKDVGASLYPFVNAGPVDVHGGHHDAGDYSKYTINSAAFIHYLVFAADVFPGVSDLDNLGLPESGDGKSDLLQEAKWEADFLARMQDADGGFYFLVYPREREYEDNVTPDKGDPQVVFPKTTAVTAAATAALAQCAGSPTFKREFPEAAAQYLEKAKKGWAFLEKAIAKYGKDGSYQKITHYGNEFMHDDELAWAACELFLTTGEAAYGKRAVEWLHPDDPNTRRWSWWRLYDSYGCAIRSYAFGARSGRLKREQLDRMLLDQCENEVQAAGEDQLRRALQSAYGTSFPEETKRTLSAGWYFSDDAAFDLAAACQLDYPALRDPRPRMMQALLSNLNYEQGCNPVNVTYLTGLGWRRQREVVDQYAWNDRRAMPPSGIPLGNVQAGFGWNHVYNQELDKLSYPPDGGHDNPYPFYDRWGDGFNLTQEFVAVNQARALGCLAWLMAQTPLKSQAWNVPAGQITGFKAKPAPGQLLTVGLSVPGLDLSTARIVWEANDQEPAFGQTYTFTPTSSGVKWVEAEAQWPDGRRVFGVQGVAGWK